MPTEREWRQIDRDRADQDLVRRAAAWLREDPAMASYAGLSSDQDAAALAVLLDVIVAELSHVDAGVRWQVIESCRVLLSEPMASPTIRRTRRR